jgi:hypothetical protein
MMLSVLYRTVAVTLAVLASGPLLAFARPPSQQAIWEQSFPADGLTTVGVDTLNGSIAVEAWDRPEVAARVIIGAGLPPGPEARRRIDATRIVPRQDGSALRLEVQAPTPASDSVSADFTLRVPPVVALELRTASGTVNVTGVAAPLSLSSSDGSIAVYNAPGPMQVETANGSVAVSLPAGVGAQLDLVTANGQISVPGGVATSRQVRNTLGGGGPLVQVRTGSGSIAVSQGP